MSNKQNQKRRLSKRERRMRVIIIIMVIGMLLSTATFGLSYLI